MKKGANRYNMDGDDTSVDLIYELLGVEYLELFPPGNFPEGLAVLASMPSLPVPLEWFDTIASPGTTWEWAMYPVWEVR